MKSAADIIVRPLITEKSMDGIAAKTYAFEVMKGATKPEIARAVEEMFGVKVAKVNTIIMNLNITITGIRTNGSQCRHRQANDHQYSH